MKILKFGGKSLAYGKPLENALDIISEQAESDRVAVVVSALADSTDRLLDLYNRARNGHPYDGELELFKKTYEDIGSEFFPEREFVELKETLSTVREGDENSLQRDLILSLGERISVNIVSQKLEKKGIKALSVDARAFLKVKPNGVYNSINDEVSEKLTNDYFRNLPSGVTPVITGFIASDGEGRTVTLGRNGTNYTASLIADFIGASEV
ncbi:MAG: bifunctional aspartate kinase/homoserine dehydrogenase I, partial [Brumimicrobium sp.]|nr:bifunctional aspartate kinase/homoserine dehydrogenase I [Brumimicrobium sp.]